MDNKLKTLFLISIFFLSSCDEPSPDLIVTNSSFVKCLLEDECQIKNGFEDSVVLICLDNKWAGLNCMYICEVVGAQSGYRGNFSEIGYNEANYCSETRTNEIYLDHRPCECLFEWSCEESCNNGIRTICPDDNVDVGWSYLDDYCK